MSHVACNRSRWLESMCAVVQVGCAISKHVSRCVFIEHSFATSWEATGIEFHSGARKVPEVLSHTWLFSIHMSASASFNDICGTSRHECLSTHLKTVFLDVKTVAWPMWMQMASRMAVLSRLREKALGPMSEAHRVMWDASGTNPWATTQQGRGHCRPSRRGQATLVVPGGKGGCVSFLANHVDSWFKRPPMPEIVWKGSDCIYNPCLGVGGVFWWIQSLHDESLKKMVSWGCRAVLTVRIWHAMTFSHCPRSAVWGIPRKSPAPIGDDLRYIILYHIIIYCIVLYDFTWYDIVL